MLICYHNRRALPQNDPIYVAFLISALETVTDMEVFSDLDEVDDDPSGFLIEVPFLQVVPVPVQFDILAETWARHSTSDEVEATLLDAAVVFAACMTATRIVNDEPSLVASWLRHGAHSVGPRILRWLPQRLEELFDQWWDDRDFLMIDDFQDMPPEQAQYVKSMMRLPEDMVQPMFDVLERGRASSNLGSNLEGLLPPEDIEDVVEIATRAPRKNSLSDECEILDGIEDRHHSLLIGPCDRESINRETESPMIVEVGVMNVEDFDCSYSDWAKHFRDLVLNAEPDSQCPETSDDCLDDKVQTALEKGVDDGTRIERRDKGWVVVDDADSYLVDVENSEWVVGEDEDFPPLYFETLQDAYRAFELAEHLAALRTKRREEALRRLRKT